ncbi:MAG: DUF2156 domain-containing protein [Desulfobulbaceae bacterium]|nr:DUF2156 domain-containing protein [Desulfobulbaceae bacterium]
MPNLVPLDLAAAPMVNRYLATHPPEISELTFTNLFAWRRGRPVWLVELPETLVFLIPAPEGSDGKWLVFGPPVGPLPLATVMAELGESVHGGVRQSAASVATLDPARFAIAADRANSDYVYRVADLAELAGRNYAAKRNLIKQCLRDHTCHFEPITTGNLDECRDLLNRWCDLRHCDLDHGLSGEWQALQESMSNFLNFGLLGGLVRVEGTVEAFAIGERLHNDTAVCHFEKSLPAIQGLGQLINQWFAAHCLRDFTYVNREQDLGIPGLRQAKESYHPTHLVEKFTAFRS